MVKRFIRTRRPLIDYPASRWAAEQSSVPSQYMPVPPPFDPSQQPDLRRGPPPNVVDWGIVRATFDSRPPRAYDFYWQDAFYAGVSQTNGYTVPIGWILIVRSILVSAFPAPTGDDLHNFPIDQWGFNNNGAVGNNASFQILIDGSPTPNFTITGGLPGIPIFDITSGDVEIPCFVLVGSGSNLNVFVDLRNISGDNTQYNINVHYYGNLLFATGRAIENEVGNADPAPVHEF